jgi:hypothetical protein
MSHKRYQYKVIEAAEAAEFETLLKNAAVQQWVAVGYGVLPDGRRSALMERKTKVHHARRHQSHKDDGRTQEQHRDDIAHDE